jgi:hypothetical protein
MGQLLARIRMDVDTACEMGLLHVHRPKERSTEDTR